MRRAPEAHSWFWIILLPIPRRGGPVSHSIAAAHQHKRQTIPTPGARVLDSTLSGNRLSNTTCLTQVSSKVTNNIAKYGDP